MEVGVDSIRIVLKLKEPVDFSRFVWRNDRWEYWLSNSVLVEASNVCYLSLCFGAPRQLWGHNRRPCPLSRLPSVVEPLVETVRQTFDLTDRIEEMYVGCIHLCIDTWVDDPQQYVDASPWLVKMPRLTNDLKWVKGKKLEGTFYQGSRPRLVCIYNKELEDPDSSTEGQVRIEYRLKRAGLCQYIVPPDESSDWNDRREQMRSDLWLGDDLTYGCTMAMEELTRELSYLAFVPEEEFEEMVRARCQEKRWQADQVIENIRILADQGWDALKAQLTGPSWYRAVKRIKEVGLIPGPGHLSFRSIMEAAQRAWQKDVG